MTSGAGLWLGRVATYLMQGLVSSGEWLGKNKAKCDIQVTHPCHFSLVPRRFYVE